MSKTLYFLLFSLFLIKTTAQPEVKINSANDELFLRKYFTIYADTLGVFTPETITGQGFSHQELGQKKLPIKTYYWLKINIQNATGTKQNFNLSYHGIFADSLVLFEKTNHGFEVIDYARSWKNSLSLNKNQEIRMPTFELSFAANETKTLYIKLQVLTHLKPELLFVLNATKYYYNKEQNVNLFFSFFAGFGICSALFSLAFFILLRHRIYLVYSIAVLIGFYSNLNADGYIYTNLSFISPYYRGPYGTNICIYIYAIFSLLYAYKFLRLNTGKIILSIWLAIISIIIAFVLFKAKIIYTEFWLNFTNNIQLVHLLVFIYLLYLGYKQNKTYFYFLLASVLPIYSLFYYFLGYDLGFYNLNLNYVFWTKIAFMFEFLVLAYGMANQYIMYRNQTAKVKLSLLVSQREIIDIQDRERDRIGRDLHDEIGNSLVTLKLFINSRFDTDKLIERINTVMDSVKSISHNMVSSNFTELPLSTSVSDLVSRFSDNNPIQYEVNFYGQEHSISNEKKMFVFRIILECISNIQKHSKARQASIQISFFETELVIVIEDNGVGINAENSNKKGIGLKNIRSRMQYLNGTMTIDNVKKGTIIMLNIPLDEKK
jgi:signal transduction histidine kinase